MVLLLLLLLGQLGVLLQPGLLRWLQCALLAA
jgi:hypothetical protein